MQMKVKLEILDAIPFALSNLIDRSRKSGAPKKMPCRMDRYVQPGCQTCVRTRGIQCIWRTVRFSRGLYPFPSSETSCAGLVSFTDMRRRVGE